MRLRVGVIMKGGDVRPVARTYFFACPNSLKGLWEDEVNRHPVPTPKENMGSEYTLAKLQHLINCLHSAQMVMLSNSVASAQTDLSGTTSLTLPSGGYWLSNIKESQIGQSTIIWDYPISVTNDMEVELSNDNAMRIEPD